MAGKDVDAPTSDPKGLNQIPGDVSVDYGGFFDPAAPIPSVSTAKWRIRLAALLSIPSWVIGFYILAIMMAGQLPTVSEDAIPVTFQAPLALQLLLLVVALGVPFSAVFSIFVQRYWTVWTFCGFGTVIIALRMVLLFIQPPTGMSQIIGTVLYILWTLAFAFAILHALRSQGFLDSERAKDAPQDWAQNGSP